MFLQIGHNNPNILKKIFSGYHDVQAHCLCMYVLNEFIGKKNAIQYTIHNYFKDTSGCKSLLLHIGSSQPQEI